MQQSLKQLDELGLVSRGKSKHRPRDAAHLYDGPYPFIQTGDVKSANFYITKYSQTYSEAGLKQSKLWEKGTLCITIAANIAETAILGIDACFPDSIIGFIADPNKACVKYIKYLMDTLKQRYQSVSQGAAQSNLSQKKLLSIKFPVPPLEKQIEISHILSSYDDLIENNLRRIQLLEQAARLIYEEWFIRFLFPGHEKVRIVDGLPEGWKKVLISDCGQIITGKTPSTKIKENWGNDVPFIKTPDMHSAVIVTHTEEYLSAKGALSQSNKFIPENSILVSCIGSVGVVAINGLRAQTNQQINSVVPKYHHLLYYLFFNFQQLKPVLEGIGGGSTMCNVNKAKFENLKIVLPSDHLIKKFSSLCHPIFDQIKILKNSSKKLAQTRDLLLPKLLNGEIQV